MVLAVLLSRDVVGADHLSGLVDRLDVEVDDVDVEGVEGVVEEASFITNGTADADEVGSAIAL